MKTQNMLRTFASLLLGALLAASCQLLQPPPGGTGTFVLRLSTEQLQASRAVHQVEDWTPARFLLSGEGPNGASFSGVEFLGTQLELSRVVAEGNWTFVVVAENEAGEVLGEGSVQLSIQRNATVNGTITLQPRGLPGELQLDLTWPWQQVANPRVDFLLTPENGIPGYLETSVDAQAGTAILRADQGTSLTPGRYEADLRLYDDANLAFRTRLAFRIVSGHPVRVEYDLTATQLKTVFNPAPAAPVGVEVLSFGANQVLIGWDLGSNPDSDIVGVQVEVYDDQGSQVQEPWLVGNFSNRLLLRGLGNGATYTLRVRTRDGGEMLSLPFSRFITVSDILEAQNERVTFSFSDPNLSYAAVRFSGAANGWPNTDRPAWNFSHNGTDWVLTVDLKRFAVHPFKLQVQTQGGELRWLDMASQEATDRLTVRRVDATAVFPWPSPAMPDNVWNNRPAGNAYLVPISGFTWPALVAVEGDTYSQGETSEAPPVRSVTLSSFGLARTEITQAQFAAFMGWNPSYYTSLNGYSNDLRRPVDSVSWFDALAFCNALSTLAGYDPYYNLTPTAWDGFSITAGEVTLNLSAKGYRLPTEAEWEFAARGGKYDDPTRYAGSDTASQAGWFIASEPQPVGTKPANEIGLNDLSGNVWEWVWDEPRAYTSDPVTDPLGSVGNGTLRVRRGGSIIDATGVAVWAWAQDAPGDRSSVLGFRPARAIELPEPPTDLVLHPSENTLLLEFTEPAAEDYLRTEVTWLPADGLSQPQVLNPGTTSLSLTSLTPGVAYTVTLRSYFSSGLSSPPVTVSERPSLVSMRRLPSGTYLRGQEGLSFSDPVHEVTLDSFLMGRFEITQGEYFAVTGFNPSEFQGFEDSPNRPVETVSWFDAVEFCNILSVSEGLTPVYTITNRTPATGYPILSAAVSADWTRNGYRLPTEAEWEYAVRAGTTTAFYWGSTETGAADHAWYAANNNTETRVVGTRSGNAWTLFDMAGNAGEWVWDYWATYTGDALTNPTGPETGSERIFRGGYWNGPLDLMGSAFRNAGTANSQESWIGFRVVRR